MDIQGGHGGILRTRLDWRQREADSRLTRSILDGARRQPRQFDLECVDLRIYQGKTYSKYLPKASYLPIYPPTYVMSYLEDVRFRSAPPFRHTHTRQCPLTPIVNQVHETPMGVVESDYLARFLVADWESHSDNCMCLVLRSLSCLANWSPLLRATGYQESMSTDRPFTTLYPTRHA